MRISHKLLSGFLLMALLVGVVGYIGYFEIGRLANNIDEIADIQTPAALALLEMQATLLEGVEEAFAYPLLNAPDEKGLVAAGSSPVKRAREDYHSAERGINRTNCREKRDWVPQKIERASLPPIREIEKKCGAGATERCLTAS